MVAAVIPPFASHARHARSPSYASRTPETHSPNEPLAKLTVPSSAGDQGILVFRERATKFTAPLRRSRLDGRARLIRIAA